MADFKTMRRTTSGPLQIEPSQIFKRLRKPPQMNDLWDGQSKVLEQWFARRTERNLVIKLNTGAGKTLVGLLICQSLLNDKQLPVIYLCPTNQLVSQTIEKANEVGIKAVPYEKGGSPLAAEFLDAQALMVGTYASLFNGISKFGVLGSGQESINIGAVICDDAHTAVSTIRDAFTVKISSESQLYSELTTMFAADFRKYNRSGTFDEITARSEHGVLEVPYTAWLDRCETVRKIIAKEGPEGSRYSLPLIRDHFELCHMLISAREIAITPHLPLINMIPAFSEAQFRIFMSATIADDSSLIRTFGITANATLNPIAPESLAGIGERMILIPALMNLKVDPEEAIKKALKTLKGKANAVVLVQSDARAKFWSDVGTVEKGNNVAAAVEKLRKVQPDVCFVLASRYEGIDLPGDACRILVLDGLPAAANTYELYRAELLKGNSSLNVSIAQKVEQGIGRATRGAGDFCVVLLCGKDLVSWITRRASLNLMTGGTRTQIRIGDEVSRTLRTETALIETANQCLDRDSDWTSFHAEKLAEMQEPSSANRLMIETATAERKFDEYWLTQKFAEASGVLTEVARKENGPMRGWLLQLAAKAAYKAENSKLQEKLQTEAFMLNQLLLPPVDGVTFQAIEEAGTQVDNLLEVLQQFEFRKGVIEEFDSVYAMLSDSASSSQFEEALFQIGRLLGFRPQRPDHEIGKGPDVLWLVDNKKAILLECKHKKKVANPLNKEEHGQLLTSISWLRAHYPNREFLACIVHPNDIATTNAAATQSYAFTSTKLHIFCNNLRTMLAELSKLSSDSVFRSKAASILIDHGFTFETMREKYWTTFKEL